MCVHLHAAPALLPLPQSPRRHHVRRACPESEPLPAAPVLTVPAAPTYRPPRASVHPPQVSGPQLRDCPARVTTTPGNTGVPLCRHMPLRLTMPMKTGHHVSRVHSANPDLHLSRRPLSTLPPTAQRGAPGGRGDSLPLWCWLDPVPLPGPLCFCLRFQHRHCPVSGVCVCTGVTFTPTEPFSRGHTILLPPSAHSPGNP